MSKRAAAICAGRGTQRLLLALLQPVAVRNEKPVMLRLASLTDELTLLKWQQHPMTRRYARNPSIPTTEEHHRWITNVLSDVDCLLTIIERDGKPLGMLRLDRRPDGASAYEVSILVAPDQFRQGIGSCALSLARQLLPAAELIAEVLPQNEASMKLFASSGYQRYDDGLLHCSPLS
jgi:RimJ/RimL family protein N-acetyltransferase